MAAGLLSSRAATFLKLSVSHRGFCFVVKDLKNGTASDSHVSETIAEDRVNDEMNKLLGGDNTSRKKNKAFIKTFKHLDEEDGVWITGSNIYLVDEEKAQTDKKRLARGIRIKIDNE